MKSSDRYLEEYTEEDVESLRELAEIDRETGIDERADLLDRLVDDVEAAVEADELVEFVAAAKENARDSSDS